MTLNQLAEMETIRALEWLKANKDKFTLVPNNPSEQFISSFLLHMPASMDLETANAVAEKYREYHDEVIEATHLHYSE